MADPADELFPMYCYDLPDRPQVGWWRKKAQWVKIFTTCHGEELKCLMDHEPLGLHDKLPCYWKQPTDGKGANGKSKERSGYARFSGKAVGSVLQG